MTSKADHTAVPDSELTKADMGKTLYVQHVEPIQEGMDSGQMRLEAMGYKQVGISY